MDVIMDYVQENNKDNNAKQLEYQWTKKKMHEMGENELKAYDLRSMIHDYRLLNVRRMRTVRTTDSGNRAVKGENNHFV